MSTRVHSMAASTKIAIGDQPERWDFLLESWLEDQGMDLLEIQHRIYQMALEKNEPPSFSKHSYNAASLQIALSCSFLMMESLLEILPANMKNKKRLLDYIEVVDCLPGYNRLFEGFLPFLTEDEYKTILEKGKRLFNSQITGGWHEFETSGISQVLSVIDVRR